MNSPTSLTERLKSKAGEVGFDLAGACPAVTPTGIHRFLDWLEQGYAGEMSYLHTRREAYEHPRSVLPGARSLLLLARNYRTEPPILAGAASGRVSRYAWGSVDYHDSIHGQLKPLVAFLNEQVPGSRSRGVVDTAPLLEREFAQLAGLGWQGKNTMLIHPRQGSWLFLAAIITDIVLDFDEPFSTDHCGTCRACLDVCPTGAFPQPYVLDASRCISYLTIELRNAIPRELRASMGEWVFGCDLCQEVCPWNRRSPRTTSSDFEPRQDLRPLELLPLFHWSDEDFRRTFRRTPLWRAKRRGLLRNAAIALGNAARTTNRSKTRTASTDSGNPTDPRHPTSPMPPDCRAAKEPGRPTEVRQLSEDLSILRNSGSATMNLDRTEVSARVDEITAALALGLNDAEPIVRGASAWALGEIRLTAARARLVHRWVLESDPDVRHEIQLALEQSAP